MTGPPKRAVLASVMLTFSPGCVFSQAPAILDAVLKASSDLMESSVIWNGRLCGVAPLQACAPRALTPLWMSLP